MLMFKMLQIKKILKTKKTCQFSYFIRSWSKECNFDKIILKDQFTTHSYKNILSISKQLSNDILYNLNKSTNLNGEKIGILCSNNYSYLCSILAVWMSNGVPFCLSKLLPNNLIDYFINDSKCKLIINGASDSPLCVDKNDEYHKILNRNNVNDLTINEREYFKPNNLKYTFQNGDLKYLILPNKKKHDDVMLLYTSGTSGNKPKGCVLTYENLFSSIDMMIETYKWSNEDSILSTLPLNHYSGLVYTVLTPFFAGAQVNLLPKFDAKTVWSMLLNDASSQNDVNMLIGVPTIYTQLCDYYNKNKQNFPSKEHIEISLRNRMRLIASGSAPLNVKTFNDWYDLTKYKIVERYGMTEIGMALSNRIDGEKVGGTVGRPIGSVRVRLVESEKDDSRVLIESSLDEDILYEKDSQKLFGELQIKGSNVFKEYLNKSEQTILSFTKDGWFKTGDTAQFLTDLKAFKIIGRTSVDVIKSGGYKISALDIEKELLAHPDIEDIAIMGLSDPVWGQRVFALIVLKANVKKKEFSLKNFKDWCRKRLPKYSVPTLVRIVDKMPRNQLGKVIKKQLIAFYENENEFKNITTI